MDNIVFYQPPSALGCQPPRLPGAVTASNAPGGHIPFLSVRQPASQVNQQNRILKDQVNKSRDASDLSQESHASDQRCRNDSVQEQENWRATRNSPTSDDNDDFPEIDELLSGIRQKRMLASTDLHSDGNDDDGFIDIDELLSGMQQKSVPASAAPNSGDMSKMVDNGTRGGSPTDSSRSTAGSGRDPIMLSGSESAGAESETDCSDLDVDVRAKSESHRPRVVDSELVDGDAFDSGAALASDRLVPSYQDDDKNRNNIIVDQTQLRLLADRPRSASSGPGSDTHQASKLQVNTDIIQGITSSNRLGVTKKLKDKGFDASAEGNADDNDGTRSAKGRTLPAVSDRNLTFVSNTSELQDSQPDDTQSPQLTLAATSPYQSPLKNDHLPKQLRRGATRNDRRKRPRTIAPIRLATTASTASAALESAELEEPKSRVQIIASDEEWEVRNTNQETVDDGSADDSNDEDYAGMSDAAGSKKGGRPQSRKCVRRTKDRKQRDVEGHSAHPLVASYQAAPATSSSSMQESDKMPIHGHFTLKTVASKVVYCLTFSQELLPRPQNRGQRQDCTTDVQESQSAAPIADPNPQWEIREISGQKMVGRERHYRVEWKDTWMPESELAGAKELVDAFMASDGSGTGGRKQRLKRNWPVTGQPEGGLKKRRGRPRKHT